MSTIMVKKKMHRSLKYLADLCPRALYHPDVLLRISVPQAMHLPDIHHFGHSFHPSASENCPCKHKKNESAL
jgi:hypothetical protein